MVSTHHFNKRTRDMLATAARLLLASTRSGTAGVATALWSVARAGAAAGSCSSSGSLFSSSRAASSASASSTTPPPPQQKPHLHVQLEPLAGELDGIFCLSLTRPEAKNAIGKRKGVLWAVGRASLFSIPRSKPPHSSFIPYRPPAATRTPGSHRRPAVRDDDARRHCPLRRPRRVLRGRRPAGAGGHDGA